MRKATVVLTGSVATIALLLISYQVVRSHYVAAKIAAAALDTSKIYSAKNRALAVAAGERLIILFGDSRVARWNPLPSVPGAAIVNRGIGAETSSQMLRRFHSDVLELRPETLVIQAGINDLVMAGLQPQRTGEITDNLRNNIELFVAMSVQSRINVILLTIIPPAEPPWYRKPVWSKQIPQYVEEANAFIRTLPQRFPVVVMESGEALNSGSASFRDDYAVDTLHLNEAAYRRINLRLKPLLLPYDVI